MDQNSLQRPQPDIYVAIPILPSQAEAWRRFVQELQGPQQRAWAAWCRRVGLGQLRVRLQTTPQRAVVLLRARFTQTDSWLSSIVDDKAPFDRWLREQIRALHGVDIGQMGANAEQELMLDIKAL
jgi:hypothetical protein